MPAVMIRCPDTGRPVSTGIEMDSNELARLPEVLSRAFCPLCRRDHAWTVRAAWIEGDPEPPEAAPPIARAG